MERIEDRSTTAFPRELVAIAAVLLVIRLGLQAFEFAFPAQAKTHISWHEALSIGPDGHFGKVQLPPADQAKEKAPPPADQETAAAAKAIAGAAGVAGRPVLLQFYADWCAPAKRMENTVLVNNEIRQLVADKFVPVRVTDRLKEDGKNARLVSDLQKRYRVFVFPTLVVVGPNGEAKASLVGNCSSLTTYKFLLKTASQR